MVMVTTWVYNGFSMNVACNVISVLDNQVVVSKQTVDVVTGVYQMVQAQ
jgi:hypothetical protein